ncbi:MAG: hypothetical protein JST59_01450 [Actinobacteria bacterium]|nr:hypothetical protein [Actinomycetota bacterium]
MVENQRRQLGALKNAMLEKDAEIARLRKLPANNVLQEMEVERQELIEETMRLKSYINSRLQPVPESLEMVEELLKVMREENEKLKCSLRLCEHEKSLVRAKRSILKKEKKSLEQQLRELTGKLSEKSCQVELLNHENKNLLLRKINQLKLMQDERDRDEIDRLNNHIDSLTASKRSLENSNTALRE